MPYCEPEDVKARAGRLKDAWGDTTPVTDGDLERFIRDAGATVDVALAAHKYEAPSQDPKVLAALVPVVADIALLTAIEATWPGGSGGSSVNDMRAAVAKRVEAYVAGLANGDIGFLVYLSSIEEGGGSGAAAFWESERGYSSWIDDWNSGRVIVDAAGELVIRSPIGPAFHKDMKL